MNAKITGNMISDLRHRAGMTQQDLGKLINVSDKTISRWESGMGYPEITTFPVLASVFGVSVDYLLTGQRKGIALLGNITMDMVKFIRDESDTEQVNRYFRVEKSVGSCVPITAIDLALLDRSIPLYAIGAVGDDERGREVLGAMNSHGINTEQVKVCVGKPTGFRDVIRQPDGKRILYYGNSINEEFVPEMVDLGSLHSQILHAGYVMLLEGFDRKDDLCGTAMSAFLRQVQDRGIKTSIHVASNVLGDYPATVIPALQYCDYVMMGWAACLAIAGDTKGLLEAMCLRTAMEKVAQQGVREKVIVCADRFACCLDVPTMTFTQVMQPVVPKEKVKFRLGLEDAFCAGCLHQLYQGADDETMLRFATVTAQCNLLATDAVSGMGHKHEIWELEKRWPRLPEE